MQKFSRFPDLVIRTLNEIDKPMRLMEEDLNLKPVEALDYPLYGLNGRFENNAWPGIVFKTSIEAIQGII